MSVNVGRQTLFLFNIDDPDNPVELAFQQRYGMIVSYKWLARFKRICISIFYVYSNASFEKYFSDWIVYLVLS